MEGQIERKKYIRAGRVDWLRFIPWLFVIIVTSAVLACGLNWTYRLGEYYVLIEPMICGAMIGGLVYLAVHLGHCRSRLVAVLTGIFAGSILYLGYYQAGIVSELGFNGITRVDLLPDYIRFRMNSDVIVDANHQNVVGRKSPLNKKATDESDEQPEPARSPMSGKTIENWLTAAFEFGCVLFAATAFGYARSRRSYCERCRKWMNQELAVFLPDLGSNFLTAFNAGQFATITTARAVPMLKATPYTGAAIDYCRPESGSKTECPIYFSIKEVRPYSAGQPGQFDTTRGKMFLDHVELAPPELLGLTPRFPILPSITGVAPTAAPFSAAPVAQPSGLSMTPTPVSVQVKPATARPDEKVLTRKNIIIGNVLSLLLIAVMLGGIGVFFGGIFVLVPSDSADRTSLSTLRMVSGIAVMAGGVALVIVSGVIGLRNPSFLGNRRLLAMCRRNFGRRAEHFLDLNDPELIFVEAVPRANWGRTMLETAEDIGFMRIDTQRREILFEGDRECIRIPVDAIISCDLMEVRSSGSDQRFSIVHAMTVIQANLDSRIWEWSFTQRWVAINVNSNKRCLRAQELRQRILALRPVA